MIVTAAILLVPQSFIDAAENIARSTKPSVAWGRIDSLIAEFGRLSSGEPLAARPGSLMPKFILGDHVEKVAGAAWSGHVVGTYSTTLTPEGYCVESDKHPGSVQIYPASALRRFQPERNIL